MGEEMTSGLPEGWTVDEPSKLPEGWTVDEPVTTPKQRDHARLKESIPKEYRVPEKTPAELKEMSLQERKEYAEDLNRQGQYLQSSQFVKGAASGGTFGLSENLDELKQVPQEEWTPYRLIGTLGEVAGSLIPLSKLIKVFQGPVSKLAAKSPVFQKQLSSLGTMFGVGVTEAGLKSLTKGEVPTGEELLEHGTAWAVLDGFLQTAGMAGRFAKSLLKRSRATGVPRKAILNELTESLAESGVEMTNPEAVSAKALEILEAPIEQTSRELAIPERELSQAERVAQEALSNPNKLEFETKLGRKAEQVTQPEKNELSDKILKTEEVTPKDLKTRKITDEPVNQLTKESVVLAEPYQPEKINFTKEAENLDKNYIQLEIDSVGDRAATEEELGSSIKQDIETQLKSRKAEYRPLYTQAEEAAESIHHVPQNTAREAGEKLKRISRLKTKPEGYGAVIKNLENVLEDAGFVIQRGEKGVIEEIISSKEVPISDTIELARRINEIVDYEAVEPTVKDALRSVARGAKKDIRAGLASNPDALAAFELAEEAHAKTAQQFSKDNIRKIRGQEASEKIAKMAESPSTFNDLREVLSPEQMQQVEREFLEKLNNQTYDKAEKSLREMKRHLSKENQKLAHKIVETKNPHNPNARKKLTQDAILNDLSTAMTNGTRPSKTLDLWKTTKGQRLAKETFHNSPNWPQVKTYLEKQSFNDMVSSVLKDGKIDIKKFNEFMKDPAAVNNIRSIGGDEAVTFFREFDTQVKQLKRNTEILDKLPKKQEIIRGKEIIKKQNRKNIAEKERISKQKEIDSEKQKEINKTISNRPEGKLGKEKIKRQKERNLTPLKETKIATEALTTQRNISKESTGVKGEKILERMVSKDFPMQAKINSWKEWIKDALGLDAQAAMTVFGIAKLGGPVFGALTLGVPGTVASLIGYKMFNKMLTSPRVRKAFIEAAKKQTNPIAFISAIEHLGKTIEED